MRALKVLTIVMGVMILAGTGVLVAVIAHRVASPASGGAPVAGATPVAGGAPVALVLDEPAGTRIAGIAATGDRLAVSCRAAGRTAWSWWTHARAPSQAGLLSALTLLAMAGEASRPAYYAAQSRPP